MKEVCFGNAISIFELLVYVTVGSILISYVLLLFGLENFTTENTFAKNIFFFGISYSSGFILNYLGIELYKNFSRNNFIETILSKNNTCIINDYNKCQEIAEKNFNYNGHEDSKYSKLLYYKMRYSIANKYSWNNFAEHANIYHYFALSLFALILTLIPITTFKFIIICIPQYIFLYISYILLSIILSILCLRIAKHFQKVHVRRIVSIYLNMPE